jgi:hypothetical protein
MCHLPYGHLKVHLRELEQPGLLVSGLHVSILRHGQPQAAYLLKKRGMRTSDRRRSGPKLFPYWRGVAIRGLLMGYAQRNGSRCLNGSLSQENNALQDLDAWEEWSEELMYTVCRPGKLRLAALPRVARSRG